MKISCQIFLNFKYIPKTLAWDENFSLRGEPQLRTKTLALDENFSLKQKL